MIVNILWTGGLDSTYRVCELSRIIVGGIIQPFYIYDRTRKSTNQELKAIRRITKIIKSNPKTVATLRDVYIVDNSEIKPDIIITEAWKVLYEKYNLGIQYDYIARFAKQSGLKFELSLEDGHGRARNFVEKILKLKLYEDGNYRAYVVDKDLTDSIALQLFECLVFPLPQFGMTKNAEFVKMNEWGLKNVANLTWFCHRPVFGLPCGHCNPCKDCINEDMAFRIPKIGQFLGLGRETLRSFVVKLR